MRNSKTRTKTLKKKLNKCKNIFYAYNELQYKYGNILDEREDVLEFKCNVKINCSLGPDYSTDFYIIKADGSTYFCSEGSMSPYDYLNLPGRTMLTSE